MKKTENFSDKDLEKWEVGAEKFRLFLEKADFKDLEARADGSFNSSHFEEIKTLFALDEKSQSAKEALQHFFGKSQKKAIVARIDTGMKMWESRALFADGQSSPPRRLRSRPYIQVRS